MSAIEWTVQHIERHAKYAEQLAREAVIRAEQNRILREKVGMRRRAAKAAKQ